MRIKKFKLKCLNSTFDPNGANDVLVLTVTYVFVLYRAKKAIELNPYEDDHWRLAGWIYDDIVHDYNSALFHYTKAIELKNGQKVTLCTRGDVYLSLNRYDEAIADYEKSLLIDPCYGKPHYGLGQVYYYQGEKEKAENAFKTALELNPKLKSRIDRFRNGKR